VNLDSINGGARVIGSEMSLLIVEGRNGIDDARYRRVHPPLPDACLAAGLHRIRYYGLLTSPTRAENIARIRALLAVPLIPIDAIKAANAKASTGAQPEEPKAPGQPCPCCGSRMRIIETFLRGQQPKHRPTPLPSKIRIDTS
jgi:hypothetical protein